MNKITSNPIVTTLFQWLLICGIVGFFSGCASAFFLLALEKVTQFRLNHSWIVVFLPIAGLIIGLLYHWYGASAVKGNNLILEAYDEPKKPIPFRMAPLVLVTTLLTHLFGGSAGREGTAVQMGAAIADLMKRFFKLETYKRKKLLVLGISAGFASVFGTPIAGALFALEVNGFKKINFTTVALSFLVAYVAYFTVFLWPVHHTHYSIPDNVNLSLSSLLWTLLASSIFGLTALLFSRNLHFWGKLFKDFISYPPLRPLVGGVILAIIIFIFPVSKYIGLGVPSIVEAFHQANTPYDFLLKLLLTGFTLGAGFKGGEVTPLFFVGATLGSALSVFIPLPIALLAGMGFVAVFSGATHTPLACTFMGLELFGTTNGIFIAIACIVAYFCSGSKGIYSSQLINGPKKLLLNWWCKSKQE